MGVRKIAKTFRPSPKPDSCMFIVGMQIKCFPIKLLRSLVGAGLRMAGKIFHPLPDLPGSPGAAPTAKPNKPPCQQHRARVGYRKTTRGWHGAGRRDGTACTRGWRTG